MWIFYYILEIIQECWWVALLMGLIAVVFMQFAPKEYEWESLDSYYNPNPFVDNTEVDPIDGSKPDLNKEYVNDESNI